MKLFLSLICVAMAALGQRSMTVAELSAFVKLQLKVKGDDRSTADFLRRVKLTQRLDGKTVESLEGLGAGKKTVAALKKLEEDSSGLEAPPAPVPVAAQPQRAAPDSVEQGEALAAMRDYALNYTSKLPNYLCIQITRRQYEPKDTRRRVPTDVIQEQLSFNDHIETYKVQMVNGKAVSNISHDALGGVRSSGEFGTMLHAIFNPDSEARFDWERWGMWDSKLVYVFSYRIEKEHGYSMRDDVLHKKYTSAYTGLVYADKESKEILRITSKTVEIPADFTVKDVAVTLEYKPTTISGHVYTLPFKMELDSTDVRGTAKNTEEFKMYQVYGADAVITFDVADEKPPVKKQP